MSIHLPDFYTLHAFDSLDSTMEEAKRRVQNSTARTGDLIWADCQTSGRGRQGRTWVSKKGNLYISLILKSHKNMNMDAQLSFVVALSLVNTLKDSIFKKAVQLKWPNDLLVGESKAGGILLETCTSGRGTSGEDWLIIGIGLNITHHPDETLFPATHLLKETVGSMFDAAALLPRWAGQFLVVYDLWKSKGFEMIRQQWLEYAAKRGEQIRVRQSDTGAPLFGTFVGMAPTGALILQEESGKKHTIMAGDVFFGSSAA
ncbi:MAG: biotin--[acetyl-CoA-carboxylase] ligase [bacterium]|nr:biotin--[acetyl-CoA-carboxylase] ligase [bacterium]